MQEQLQAGCRNNLIWVVLLIALLAWNLWSYYPRSVPRVELPYSVFINQVEAGNVAEVKIVGQTVTGTFHKPVPWSAAQAAAANPGRLPNQPVPTPAPGAQVPTYTAFTSTLPPQDDPTLLPLLREKGVVITAEVERVPWLLSLLINGLPFVLLIGLLFLSTRQMRQAQGSIFQFGKSRAERYDEGQPTVTFADIAGEDQAKLELAEVVDFLRNPSKYLALGAKIPHGVLLVGPPGTGKTLFARAVAGEAGAPFFNISASEFVEMFVGVGASRVRDLFDAAKKEAPAIVFIDEIDAVGRRRGAGLGGGNDEREQTLNQILVELDGFTPSSNVIVIAATNRPDVLDPALLRPGRFDRQITVGLPDRAGRLSILEIHIRGKPLDEEVDLNTLARATPGFSGADLANLANEAALHAARQGHRRITNADFDAALDKILLGLERPRLMNPEARKVIAYHEAGHALVARLMPGTDPVNKVTIIPRGRALGVTQQLPMDDRLNYPRNYLIGRLAVMLGGRAGEEVAVGEITTGAENDLQEAAKLARRMVTRWGMSDELGVLALPSDGENPFLGYEMAQHENVSPGLATLADEATRRLVEEAHDHALELLRTHRALLDKLADLLLEHETVDADALAAVWGPVEEQPPSVEPSPDGVRQPAATE
ncbi:MAG TPA: cell division protein FtsH [Chloroflexi bacterium]|nr:cell division protein FtsH [Chloroflexota bacterium]